MSEITSSRTLSLPALIRVADHAYQSSAYNPLPWNSHAPLWKGVNLPKACDAFCVAQSITATPFTSPSSLDHLVVFFHQHSTKPTPFTSALQVSSFGNSSITYTNEISTSTSPAISLARLQRTFVRVGPKGPLSFSDPERAILQELVDEGLKEDSTPAPPPPLPAATPPTLKEALGVTLARSDVNFGGHVDHAALAQIALRGIDAVRPEEAPLQFSINYRSQSKIRDNVVVLVGFDSSDVASWEIRQQDTSEVVASGTAGAWLRPSFESEKLLKSKL